jgi:hypothetical protein
MGTLDIIRSLLVYIQGESHPIYLAEKHEGASLPRFDLERLRSWVFLLLLLAIPLLMLVEQLSGVRLSAYRDVLLLVGLALVGGLLSVGWTAPLAMLAGQGISRECTARTWNTLLVTPYPTEEILLAKAAADVSPVWKLVVSLTFIASLPGLFIAAVFILLLTTRTGQSALLGVVYMGLGMVAIIVEREQEIALSVVLGIMTAFASDSRRVALLLGLIGGLLIRLVQALITILLALTRTPLDPPNFVLLNVTAGSATLVAVAPEFFSVLVIVGLIVIREMLIRALFAWSVRRAREG